MFPIEEELIEASGFEPAKKYANRQDYLAALARAVSKMSEDNYDLISDEAANWYETAFKAIKEKDEIQDFDDEDQEEDNEGQGDEDSVDDEEITNDEELEEEEEEVAEQDVPEETESEPEPEPEPEPVPEPKKAKAKKKERKSQVNPNPLKPKDPADYERLSGEKDKFGVYMGTKTHDAVQMYERGTTAKELNEVLGGRYYNILNRLCKEGHKVLKEDGVIILIHKDDFGKKAKGSE